MPSGPRVAAYLRVSTADQSTELQRRELEVYAAARGWATPMIYEDHGASGTTAKRPQLQRLMQDARARRVNIVLVWKLDRFARSLKDLILMLQELSELGVSFVSLKDNLDMTTSAGRLMVHMLGAFAEFEASLIRERVRAGIANARANGKQLGRPKTRNDESIKDMRSRGLSIRQIAVALRVSKGAVQRALKEYESAKAFGS